MGSADIVPGVSGGTIALILGVYEQLIDSIKLVSGQVLKTGLKGEIHAAIKLVPWRFLLPLMLGLFTAVLTLATTLEWLLMEHPVYVWSFFFGLVLASIHVVAKKVMAWNRNTLMSFVLGTIFAYIVVGLVPMSTPATLPMFFLAGAIAICAMILPGISGSFLLIILGKYQQILAAVSNRDILTLGVFLTGAVLGLSLFSRILSWLFSRYHDLAMAALAGIMFGSLRKIWPWKLTLTTYTDSHGVIQPLTQKNILPQVFGIEVLVALGLMLAGTLLIIYFSKYDAKN